MLSKLVLSPCVVLQILVLLCVYDVDFTFNPRSIKKGCGEKSSKAVESTVEGLRSDFEAVLQNPQRISSMLAYHLHWCLTTEYRR